MTVVVVVVELLRLFQTKHEFQLYCIKFINITFLCFIKLYYITFRTSNIRACTYRAPRTSIRYMKKCTPKITGVQPEIFQGRGGFTKLGYFDKLFIKTQRKKAL